MTKKAKSFTIKEKILEKLIKAAEDREQSCSSIVEKSLEAYLNKSENLEANALTEAQLNQIEEHLKKKDTADLH